MNHTLTERAKGLLFDADLPKRFWAEAVSMAAYIINRMLCSHSKKGVTKTPDEAFTNKKTDLNDLKVFSLKVMVNAKAKTLQMGC